MFEVRHLSITTNKRGQLHPPRWLVRSSMCTVPVQSSWRFILFVSRPAHSLGEDVITWRFLSTTLTPSLPTTNATCYPIHTTASTNAATARFIAPAVFSCVCCAACRLCTSWCYPTSSLTLARYSKPGGTVAEPLNSTLRVLLSRWPCSWPVWCVWPSFCLTPSWDHDLCDYSRLTSTYQRNGVGGNKVILYIAAKRTEPK